MEQEKSWDSSRSDPGSERWLPIEAAARYIGVSPKAIRDWIDAEKIR
jgi:hypothetical protein